MASETHSAVQGLAASLDASPSPRFDGTHRIRAVYGTDPDRAAICMCGERIDGADIAQVKELHRLHAIAKRHEVERERAAEVTPERLLAIRESLRLTAERKGSA